MSGRDEASAITIDDGSTWTTCTGTADAAGLGGAARLSIAVAIRVFCVLTRKGTSRQKLVVNASSLVDTMLAPPPILTVVFSRDVPQTSIVDKTLTGSTGARTGAGNVDVSLIAGVPTNGSGVPRFTLSSRMPSSSPQASIPSKTTTPPLPP